MTTSGICELFGFARPRRRENGSASGPSGWKMACVLLLLCAATAIVSQAQVFRTLVNFNGTDGAWPTSALVQGLDGSFYGTTESGGLYRSAGTVFRVTPGGTLTTLYSFCSQTNCPDGTGPTGGLVQASDGNFYGTTTAYGANAGPSDLAGTVFKMTPSGSLTTLYSFCAQTNCTDGIEPSALVQGTDGNFYGTTYGGGQGPCVWYGCGTVFKITPSGTLTTLHTFCAQTNCPDGGGPLYPLVQGTDGNFYGTTVGGGTKNLGTIFKITPSGTLTTLYSFCPETGCTDGGSPSGTLVQGSDGNFYGATDEGGGQGCQGYYGCGTVFKITPSGTLTTLHSFSGPDGKTPNGLLQATDGNLYGTTWGGATYGVGAVFRITPGGTFTTLHSFKDTDGYWPFALVQATNGTLYGTTASGGLYGGGMGTLFSLCVGLGWFTEELPNYGKVGATIDILGTNLTGASSVTFNGIAAPFTVVSPTLIQATVPPGATTGYVRVTLPGGRIPSNKKFRVTPQITSFTPTDGPVGTLVTITGVSLTQTREVTIRGVHASFTVVDDGTVTATVPTGATTGRIRITGPGGAATSTTNFTVD